VSELEAAIRNAARSGRLNHVSVGFINGKWSASYRGVEDRDGRIVAHSDPVSALMGALTGRKIPEPPPPAPVAKKKKPTPVVEDDEDLL